MSSFPPHPSNGRLAPDGRVTNVCLTQTTSCCFPLYFPQGKWPEDHRLATSLRTSPPMFFLYSPSSRTAPSRPVSQQSLTLSSITSMKYPSLESMFLPDFIQILLFVFFQLALVCSDFDVTKCNCKAAARTMSKMMWIGIRRPCQLLFFYLFPCPVPLHLPYAFLVSLGSFLLPSLSPCSIFLPSLLPICFFSSCMTSPALALRFRSHPCVVI
ncbi:hypothetical protein QBC45DRAFT_408541 [Copromyces sp. CBS 386.78]|nr:hypothetical protein QBC45DRAFT_408541 [Copromyces sp. CBS 386.78]